jgi:hypothetical protein
MQNDGDFVDVGLILLYLHNSVTAKVYSAILLEVYVPLDCFITSDSYGQSLPPGVHVRDRMTCCMVTEQRQNFSAWLVLYISA